MRPFAIRRGTEADILTIARHRAAMFRDMGKLPPALEPSLENATVAYVRGAVERGEYLPWIAESSEAAPVPIGGAGVQLRPILPRPAEGLPGLELGPEAIVLNVYVEPAWRRQGVAEMLMRALLDDLDSRGIRRIVLHASRDGRRLYEKLGFTPTNEMRFDRPPQPHR